jgi:hypothetical protein
VQLEKRECVQYNKVNKILILVQANDIFKAQISV